MSQHVYNFRRRDPLPFERVADTTGLTVAAEVDPRAEMPPIYNQGQLGSCTANAVAAAAQYDMHLDGHPLSMHRPSRLLVYYCERKIEGDLGQGDTGAYGHDGFLALQRYGWVPERDWPYRIYRYQVDPPAQVWQLASQNLFPKQVAVVPQDEASIKSVLSNNQTVAFGFTVYDSFESNEVATTGIVPMPGPGEQVLGGHEVLAIGYLEAYPDHVLCRNSWGVDWGLEGYFLFPWQYLLDGSLVSDLRTIVRPAA